MNRVILFIARGFGAGLAPKAPGTFGSLVGFVWFALLLETGSLFLYILGCALGMIASIWICGRAEKLLNRHDPSSVVLDEIIAIPICFLSWLVLECRRVGGFPGSQYIFTQHWLICVITFVTFRLFDIWKPPPVFQAQSLKGGLGVTMDDVLAAGYVNIIGALLFYFGGRV